MKFWTGVTDNEWYGHLQSIHADEVNFWQPSAKAPFANAPTGMPFLFKLKSPHNHIAGGGFFVTYSQLPLSLAWEAFGEKNGRPTRDAFYDVIRGLKKGATDGNVGCTVLANTVFFDKEDWLENPPGWSSIIVRGKMYDSGTFEGMQIWSQVRDLLFSSSNQQDNKVSEKAAGYGENTVFRPRLGQSAFRVLVTDAYKRQCAITGENTLVALEAAHIVPFANEQSHDVQNGLLLRADFHRLYDQGLVGVSPELEIKISPRIREAWFNGKSYYRLDGKPMAILPEKTELQPDRDRLKWHCDNVFQG